MKISFKIILRYDRVFSAKGTVGISIIISISFLCFFVFLRNFAKNPNYYLKHNTSNNYTVIDTSFYHNATFKTFDFNSISTFSTNNMINSSIVDSYFKQSVRNDFSFYSKIGSSKSNKEITKIESTILSTLKPEHNYALTSVMTHSDIIETSILKLSSKEPVSIIESSTYKNCIQDKALYSFENHDLSCRTNSPYNPYFQNNLYFGYPILQIIGCNNAKIVLKCPLNQFINIYAAYYGIQQNTQTYCTENYNKESPSICYRSDSFDMIYSLCQNKTSCYLYANRAYFGDPCTGFNNKQLLVQYQCVDNLTLEKLNSCSKVTKMNSICPFINDTSVIQKEWCSFNNITLNCFNRIIKIVCVVYGIDPNLRSCGFYYIGSPSACNSKNTFTNIQNLCENKTKCTFNSSSLINICPKSYTPILVIQYECVDISFDLLPSLVNCNNNDSSIADSNFKILSGTCPSLTSSIYPSFLKSYYTINFNYILYEQILCYGSILYLYCSPNSLIYINSVYFGIQPLTNSFCTTNNLPNDFEDSTVCYIPFLFDNIKKFCNYKNSCTLESTETSLGIPDPCPNFQDQEQLFIQYQCIDSDFYNFTVEKCDLNEDIPFPCNSTSLNVNEKIWCDNGLGNGSNMSIICLNEKKITIMCSFYGIHSSIQTCNVEFISYPICYYNTVKTLQELCNEKSYCVLNNFSEILNDVCNGLSKTLYVQWECI